MTTTFWRQIGSNIFTFELIAGGLRVTNQTAIENKTSGYWGPHTVVSDMTRMEALRTMAVMVNRLRSVCSIQLCSHRDSRLASRLPDALGMWSANSWTGSRRGWFYGKERAA